MPTIAGPAGQLYVDDGGIDGLPLLLLHSYAGSTAHWKAQLTHLRRRRRALAMDLRGHGRSEVPSSGAYSIGALAEDVAAVADRLDLRRFVLVGHSMGGAAAVAYAGKHPRRVAGLVLAGTPGKSSDEEANKIMGALHADYDKVMAGYWNSLLEGADPSVLEVLQAGMREMGREPSLAMIGAMFEFDPLPDLARYPGPKLIVDTVHGDNAMALYRQVPDISRKVIAGTSHWAHMDKPHEFNRALDEFLAWLA
jgi:pimeloyl-ACP methyl ester carboxylesterase